MQTKITTNPSLVSSRVSTKSRGMVKQYSVGVERGWNLAWDTIEDAVPNNERDDTNHVKQLSSKE